MRIYPGLVPAEIYLPSPSVDLTKWAVVACDQFTSQPEYWNRVKALAEGVPSTLHITQPEIDLASAGERIPRIQEAMRAYLQSGALLPRVRKGFVLTERVTESGARLGLIAAVDLEQYDYHKETTAPIRATEETIESRIPARVKIRRGAAVEAPHVLLLMNDTSCSLLENLYARRAELKQVYDFTLMQGGGTIEGYALVTPEELQSVQDALETLDDGSGLLFAVGDGNHSLASAKAYWEEVKTGLSPREAETHPARYALVELVNIHSEAMIFAPIHRVIFHADASTLLADWEAYRSEKALASDGGNVECLWKGGKTIMVMPKGMLEVAVLQRFLDQWLAAHPDASIDYIHGDVTAAAFAEKENTIAFLLPTPSRDGFFESVINGGSLPRKTFSMGHAVEKRYYLECRKIVP